MAIGKAAVVGAGLMGGGIAAHIANAGHDVVLLDIVAQGGGNRSALAAQRYVISGVPDLYKTAS